MIPRCDVLGLTASRDGGRVTGVRILRRADGSAEETVPADLVVAATGRDARVPAWLEGLGYPRPPEERLPVGVAYASRHLRLPEDALGGDKMVLVGAVPDRPRVMFLFAQEGERWILSLGGYGPEHRPPGDPDGHTAFAATVAPPEVLDAIRAAEPLDEVATHAFPVSLRRRYERLRRFPEGLLVCGDALCSFNPTYGQGMTVAAAQAVAVRECLQAGPGDLARRFFAAAAAPIDHAWTLSTGADLALPVVEARRPLRVRILNAYLRRLQATAEADPVVAGAFIAVVGMREPPPALLRPAIARRVLRGPRATAWREGIEGVRRSELHVDGVRTPLREAGPPDAREAVVFLHGNPGSSADWEPLLAAVGRRGAPWPGTRRGSAAPRGPTASRSPSTPTPPSWGAPSTPWASSGSTWSPTTSAAPGACAGRPATRSGSPAPCSSAPAPCPATAGTPSRASGGPPSRASCSWRPPPGPASARCCAGTPRGLPRAFVDGMYDDFDRGTRRAVLGLYRSVPDVGAAGERLAAALRPLDRPALVLWGRHDPYLAFDAEQPYAVLAFTVVGDRVVAIDVFNDPELVAKVDMRGITA